jgi:protein-tyrosine phosphatase
MIDIHSHILWGLDDGARTLEDSIAMARMAAEHGTTDLVATPHANPTYKFDPDVIAQRLAELNAATGGAPRIYSGCDFHLSYDNIQDAVAHPRKYTINQSKYLMVEFSDLLVFKNTSEILDHLMHAGMTPVITHPERNGLLRQRVEEMAQWVDAGARVQITAQSLLGEFGRRAREFCHNLLARRLVHFVASDAHDCQRRPPVLDAARGQVASEYSEALAATLFETNPGATLTGDPVEAFSGDVSLAGRKWYKFWR